MKVLVINCGSSSLKYQLIDMDGEKVLCKGLCERIGMESSMITHEANGHKATTPAIFPTHTEAFTEVVKKMTTGEGKVIDSVSEIDAIYRFGRLSGSMEVKKFTSALVQSMEKGGAELSTFMERQSSELWNFKRQKLLQSGEKAATKLLLPIMLIFIGILIIVMTAAFAGALF